MAGRLIQTMRSKLHLWLLRLYRRIAGRLIQTMRKQRNYTKGK
jgi:hypothetical protein